MDLFFVHASHSIACKKICALKTLSVCTIFPSLRTLKGCVFLLESDV